MSAADTPTLDEAEEVVADAEVVEDQTKAPDGATDPEPEAKQPEPQQATAPAVGREVVVRQPKALSKRDPVAIAKHFAASGFFRDTDSLSKAVVKIAAGEELGIGPMAAVQGLTIIEGRLGMTANLMATLVQQHPVYSYRVVETTNDECLLRFYENGELLGESHFEIADAQRAGLVKPNSNWQKWPKAMCFARALTQGVRTYCPAVTAGAPAYTQDELEEIVTVEVLDDEPTHDEASVSTAPPRLAADRVNILMEGLLFVGATVKDAQQILGAAGIDSELRAQSRKALRERIEQLTDAEADALEVEIQNEADGEREEGQ